MYTTLRDIHICHNFTRKPYLKSSISITYRRLVASGWAQDSDGYAKWASKMPALTYDCTIAEKSNTQADCTKDTYTAEAGHSLNWHKERYPATREETLEKAVTAWYEKLANVDLDDQTTYNDKVKANAEFFANVRVLV
ncbi:hypothetical protein ANCDUO_14253 [Ancylostoma duodenale]|uniref:SCP domain-containing protein n=1 Tax=Ancylostoma duodenale TaxID=51022 RepID=A0A0C2G9M9_9BILA|nr:hypothetical protein ANCDUO_14253 [Ancylostoma duodenale]